MWSYQLALESSGPVKNKFDYIIILLYLYLKLNQGL